MNKMRLSVVLIATAVFGFSTSVIRSQPASEMPAQFVGVWSLVSWTRHWEDGTTTSDPRSVGFLIYTADGRMCWNGMDPNRPQWSDPDNPTVAELASTYRGAAGYCSRVEAHPDQGYVLHHVESANWPLTEGFVFKRTFEFDGPDRLILSEDPAGLTPPLTGSVLVWERIE